MSVPAQWFSKRRGLALGIVSSGAGIGGVVLPFVQTAVNNTLGIAWAYRVIGFICLAGNILICILVREKYPGHKKGVKNVDEEVQTQSSKKASMREIFDFTILKDVNYLMWVISTMVSVMVSRLISLHRYACKSNFRSLTTQ